MKRMAREIPPGAPKVLGELLKLGFEISERTVSRYLARRTPRTGDAAQQWGTFLKNHCEAIAAMDFFTVPTVTFRLLYCFFVIDHHRRKIRTSVRSPWQNSVAERWVGSARRECLDHVIA